MVGTLHLDTCGKGERGDGEGDNGGFNLEGKRPTATLRIREEGNDL